ncbi:SUKH-4 family immunity protein [Streptomyces sp. TE33382]
MITYALLVEVFGENDVYRSPGSALAERVSDPATREVLRDIGLPGQLGNVLVVSESAIAIEPERMIDRYVHGIPELPGNAANFWWLASAAGGDICVDGTTGKVFFTKDDYTPPFSCINESLATFAHCMLVIERDVLDNEIPEDSSEFDSSVTDLVNKVAEIDVHISTESALFWPQVIEFYLQELSG